MSRIIYNKLIRDHIPEIIAKDGMKYCIETMELAEFENGLLDKLMEEAKEAHDADADHLIIELSDISEVIDAILKLKGVSRQVLEAEQKRRRFERGGFDKMLKLLWTEKTDEDRLYAVSTPQTGYSSKNGRSTTNETYLMRLDFWAQLLSRAQTKTHLFTNKKPRRKEYLFVEPYAKGIAFKFLINDADARIELYIENLKDVSWVKYAFDQLEKNKFEIEAAFGAPLIWARLNNNKASVIRYIVSQSCGLQDKDSWTELQHQLIDAMVRFEKALRVYVQIIK